MHMHMHMATCARHAALARGPKAQRALGSGTGNACPCWRACTNCGKVEDASVDCMQAATEGQVQGGAAWRGGKRREVQIAVSGLLSCLRLLPQQEECECPPDAAKDCHPTEVLYICGEAQSVLMADVGRPVGDRVT